MFILYMAVRFFKCFNFIQEYHQYKDKMWTHEKSLLLLQLGWVRFWDAIENNMR